MGNVDCATARVPYVPTKKAAEKSDIRNLWARGESEQRSIRMMWNYIVWSVQRANCRVRFSTVRTELLWPQQN
jgi:hypothetical protein